MTTFFVPHNLNFHDGENLPTNRVLVTDQVFFQSQLLDNFIYRGRSLIRQHYNRIACGGIFGTNGSTFAQSGMDHVQVNYTEILDLVRLFSDPNVGLVF